MKIAVIDNNEIYSSLLTKIIAQHGFESLSINPLSSEIEKILEDLKSKEPSLIFLNAEIYFNQNESLSSQVGIDFLKHIRLTEDLGEISKIPIVIYSYGSKYGMLRGKPENLIILSPGSYYLNVFDLNKIIAKGLLHDDVGFLFGDQWLEPIKDLAQLKPYVEADTRDIILEDRHSIANWWGPQRLLLAYKLAKGDELPQRNPVMQNFEKEKKKLAVKKLLFIKDSQVKLDESRKQAIVDELSTENCRDKDIGKFLKNEDGAYKKVLYIDDEAEVGWANVFKQIFYPSIQDFFEDSDMVGNSFAIQHNGEKVFQIYKSFEEAENYISPVTLREFALVILDLRNKKTDANKLQPDDLSGVKLLKKIKNEQEGDPSIPVIVVTASNKQWNYERVLALGANGYWIKESPEFGINDEYSLINYLKLRNNVISFFGKEYLRKMWLDIKECEKLEINNITEIMFMLKDVFYRLQYKERYEQICTDTDSFLRGLILTLGNVWESHRGKYKFDKLVEKRIVDSLLYSIRGTLVHKKNIGSFHISIDDVVIMFDWTILGLKEDLPLDTDLTYQKNLKQVYGVFLKNLKKENLQNKFQKEVDRMRARFNKL